MKLHAEFASDGKVVLEYAGERINFPAKYLNACICKLQELQKIQELRKEQEFLARNLTLDL